MIMEETRGEAGEGNRARKSVRRVADETREGGKRRRGMRRITGGCARGKRALKVGGGGQWAPLVCGGGCEVGGRLEVGRWVGASEGFASPGRSLPDPRLRFEHSNSR